MKQLSIVIPSYNVDKTLESTLESICIDEILDELDVLIVDDGSQDTTPEIGKRYANLYPGSVRYIRKDNGGHGSTINTGIKAAVGRYFRVLDGDDTLEREGLLYLLRFIKQTDYDLIATHYQKVSFGKQVRAVPMRFEGVNYQKPYRLEELNKKKNVYFGIHSMTIKTSILRENNITLQEHTFYVDVEFGLLPIPYVQTVVFLDSVLYNYSVGNPQQSIDPQQFVKRYEDHYRVVKRMVIYVRGLGPDEPCRDYCYSVLQKVCFTHYMLSAFYDNDLARGKARCREFDAWLKQTDPVLYKILARSLYLRSLRAIHFYTLPRSALLKRVIKSIYTGLKPLFKKRNKFTY